MAYHLPVCIDDGNYNSTISMSHVSLTVRYMKYFSFISHDLHGNSVISAVKSLRVPLLHRYIVTLLHCYIVIVYEILTTFKNAYSMETIHNNIS